MSTRLILTGTVAALALAAVWHRAKLKRERQLATTEERARAQKERAA